MQLWQRKTLAGDNVGEPGPLPDELVGLDLETLTDLSWVDPALNYADTGFVPVDIPDPVEVPQSISRMQAKQALLAAGQLSAVEAAMASAPPAVQIYWADASHFHRSHPIIEQMGQALGMSSDDLDQLFIAAAQIV